MRKSIRLSALLMVICMVLSLLPLGAFAATRISAVTITGLDAPVLSETPDYTVGVSTTPANAASAVRVDWYIYNAESNSVDMLPTDYRFAVGDEVYAYVQITAADGYTFGEKGTYYTGAVNMKDYDAQYPAQVLDSNFLGVFTKDYRIVAETAGELITAVSVADVDMPIAGESPDFEGTVTAMPADALAEAEVEWWMYDFEAQEDVRLGTDHVFAEDQLVKVRIHMVPKAGYRFGTPLDTYAGTVTIPYEEEKELLEIQADGSMYVNVGEWYVPSVSVGKFVDVPDGEWFTDAVAWAVDQGVTTGVDEYHFAPDEGCTRAQAVTFLWRAAGKPEPTLTECAFADVDVNGYYYKAVLWAVENGITTGTDETHFEPDAVCTRAHIVTFLYRTLKGAVSETAGNPFVDVPAGEWYTAAVLWAAENGVTTGVDAEHFEPEGTCIRSQIVTFIYRAVAK